ncbi:glycoside hydrolase [Tricharina praecox]|uniref:glycoside hydrolase n=1 Tax=Tricharina praecox TaxID=43433 RepID=UPI00221F01EF|nr:glycoside hydrolase [Tricharina praecox]KAI5853313.1 glycoside hydrolase [Tricharina praecox]
MKLHSFISLLAVAQAASAISLNVDDKQSIKEAAATAAKKLAALYPRNETWFIPGDFGVIQTADGRNDKGYYWWEGGAAMGAWIDYWAITGDDSYNSIVTEGILHQVGENNDFQPANQTLGIANDDQATWAIAALSAAERGFPDPPADKPQWITLAKTVFDRQAARWDEGNCSGGLRWLVFNSSEGYDYKNSAANGLFFQLAARLARYTGNETYVEWSEKAYNWARAVKLIGPEYEVYDGLHDSDDMCGDPSKVRWTHTAGAYIAGAANLYDYYSSANDTSQTTKWQLETSSLLNATDEAFFNQNDGTDNIMRESACESPAPFTRSPTCNTDQRFFKALMSRFLGATYQLAPFTRDYITERLRASALGAARSCTGKPGGDTCGLSWIIGEYDDSPYGIAEGGVSEHMAALEVFQNLLVGDVDAPKTQESESASAAGKSTTVEDGGAKPTSVGARAVGAGALVPAVAFAGIVSLALVLV